MSRATHNRAIHWKIGLRDGYRALFSRGRTYAAFRDVDREFLREFPVGTEILDPMSGYGRTSEFCRELGLSCTLIECNPPQYLWQLVTDPANRTNILELSRELMRAGRKWPRPRVRIATSDEFFPSECYSLVTNLVSLGMDLGSAFMSDEESQHLACAIIIPFAGRLACLTPGDNSAHVKEGGVCVFKDWQTDFVAYLDLLMSHVSCINGGRGISDIRLGNSRTVDLGRKRFKGMLTSPPYPNHRDFFMIWEPENCLLRRMQDDKLIRWLPDEIGNIGSNFVKGREIQQSTLSCVEEFVTDVESLKRSKRSAYDDEVYYLPYFLNYFADLFEAYQNISRFAASQFSGFISVVDNTHRGVLVPVANTVREMWEKMGFESKVVRTIEMSHVGVKNSGIKGARALHCENVLRVYR